MSTRWEIGTSGSIALSCHKVLTEGLLRSKNLFSKSFSKRPKTKGYTPFQTPSAIFRPPSGHVGFAGGGALQAVSECPGAARLVFTQESPKWQILEALNEFRDDHDQPLNGIGTDNAVSSKGLT